MIMLIKDMINKFPKSYWKTIGIAVAIVMLIAVIVVVACIIASPTDEEASMTETSSVEESSSIISAGITTTTPVATAAPIVTNETSSKLTPTDRYDYKEEATILAKIVYCEARGVESVTEQANVIWTILNRYDAGYGDNILEVALAPHQFAYRDDAPTVDDYGRNLIDLAQRILYYWAYEDDNLIFRTLPENYFYFRGYNGHNWFFSNYTEFKNKNYSVAYGYNLGRLEEDSINY